MRYDEQFAELSVLGHKLLRNAKMAITHCLTMYLGWSVSCKTNGYTKTFGGPIGYEGMFVKPNLFPTAITLIT